jgi:hypothetical protein
VLVGEMAAGAHMDTVASSEGPGLQKYEALGVT